MSRQHWIEDNAEAIRSMTLIPGPAPECVVTECPRTAHTRGLCKAHYHRARRSFDPKYTDSRSADRKANQ